GDVLHLFRRGIGQRRPLEPNCEIRHGRALLPPPAPPRAAKPDANSRADSSRPVARPRRQASALGAGEDLHEFGHRLPLHLGVAAPYGARHAMAHMVAENSLLDSAKSRAHRRDLRYKVDAVAIVLDHARDAANLPLDTAQ